MASAAFRIRDLNNRTQTAKSEAAFVKDILIPKILQKNLMFFPTRCSSVEFIAVLALF